MARFARDQSKTKTYDLFYVNFLLNNLENLVISSFPIDSISLALSIVNTFGPFKSSVIVFVFGMTWKWMCSNPFPSEKQAIYSFLQDNVVRRNFVVFSCNIPSSSSSSLCKSCSASTCRFRTMTNHPSSLVGYAWSTTQYFPSCMIGPGDIRFFPDILRQEGQSTK